MAKRSVEVESFPELSRRERMECPQRRAQSEALPAVFYVENIAPQDAPATIDVLIDVLKEEVPELRERFTECLAECFASYQAGQGLDVNADRPIRDLQEVKAMFATKFQEYSRKLKNEGRQEGHAAERLALARRLLERGETVTDVADLTGLAVGEVAKLVGKG